MNEIKYTWAWRMVFFRDTIHDAGQQQPHYAWRNNYANVNETWLAATALPREYWRLQNTRKKQLFYFI